jgi:ABC-type glycerol-3-phosphate transport system substrate-binding protein
MRELLRRTRVPLLLVLLLGACGPLAPAAAWPEGAPPRNAALADSPPITLKAWFAADYVDQPPIRDLEREFEQAYPNIAVELEGVVWEEMPNRLRLAIGQGEPPDLAHQHAFVMGAQGLAEPLDDLWANWGEADAFMPGALDDVTWQGVRYGVPLDINALFMIYNRAMFEQAGLALPGTGYSFAQLKADLAKLTPADGSRFGMALTASGWDMYGVVRAGGGDLLLEQGDRTTVTFDDPRVVEAVRLYTELGWKDRLGSLPPPQPRQSDHPVVLFGQRKVAVFFSGPWDLTRLKQEAPPEVYAEVGTALLPVVTPGAAGGSVQGGGSLFVPRGAQHREAAFELMKWATSDRYELRLAQEMGRYPVRTATYEDAFFDQDPLLVPFLEQLKTARPYRLEAYGQADRIWSEAVRAAFSPNADVERILREAQQQAQQAIDMLP